LRRDLVTLAKSGAIADAFVASADEHLAEIVSEVQDLGLRVVVLHITSDGGWTIPQPLRQECDDIVEITGIHLGPFVDLIRGAEPATPDERRATLALSGHARLEDELVGAGSRAGPAPDVPAAAGAHSAPAESDYGSPAQLYAQAVLPDSFAAAAEAYVGPPSEIRSEQSAQTTQAGLRTAPGWGSDQRVSETRGPGVDAR